MNYDYIIVGGGSAGCVLASRLSENKSVNVLLLEAGRKDSHPLIHMPVGFAKMTTGPFTWGLKTVPQLHANQREIPYAQGKVLGGGSSINAEVFTRGHASDYNRWENEEGCKGWSFEEIKSYFIRSENNELLADDYHGNEGPLGVSNQRHSSIVSKAFVKSCQQLGMPYNADFNGRTQEGTGLYQITVKDGKRCSAATGYLNKKVRSRSNLKIMTNVTTHKLRFIKNRVIGVDAILNNQLISFNASSEVIVAAGATGSPKLLMLSGIGDADDLKQHGIEIQTHLPGVGMNLNDHFGIDIVYELNKHDSYDKYNKLWWAAIAGLQYILYKNGPVASNIVEGGAFWHSNLIENKEVPDLQFHFLAGAGVEDGVPAIKKGSGCTMNSYVLRPKSRGSVKLQSSDYRKKILVDPAFISHPDDIKVAIEGLRISREIMQQKAFKGLIKQEHFPGSQISSDKELTDYIKQFGRTSYHPVGTCKMGIDDMAVVNSKLKVYGVEGLRVVDSSVMPSLIGSNTNAPTIMIAEKASDMILNLI